ARLRRPAQPHRAGCGERGEVEEPPHHHRRQGGQPLEGGRALIGAKSLVSLAALAAALIATLATGILMPDRLLLRDGGALFFAGAFAAVVGSFMFRFWRLNERSLSYFRWSTEATDWENEAHFVGAGRFNVSV